jgi:AraC-like DNA-binding protein
MGGAVEPAGQAGDEARAGGRVLRGEFPGGRWEVVSRRPAPPLRPFVRELFGYLEVSAGPVARRELPSPAAVWILELGPPLKVVGREDGRVDAHPSGFVAGLDDGYTVTRHAGLMHGVQVYFTPLGARRVLGLPMHTLSRRVVALGDVLGKEGEQLAARLREEPTWAARFARLEAFLALRLAATPEAPREVAWAVGRLLAPGGHAVPVGALERELGWSPKRLIGQFQEHVGLPPKLVARLGRFDRLIQALKGERSAAWAELALAHGYFDQPHLVRDFRQFAGVPPTRWLREHVPGLTSAPLE